ncbi:MAG TPA: type IV secretion system protein VirB10 [Steroidobacteraceae bacterium]|nr:type IV secretion system protein VirB10 [Steroidobacteraceae bacterium]
MNSMQSGNVDGERGLPAVRHLLSLHSRVGNLLAIGLMLAMGAAVLAAYYVHAGRRQSRVHEQAQAAFDSRAKAEMALPALGAIMPSAALVSTAGSSASLLAMQSAPVDVAANSKLALLAPVATASAPPPMPSTLQRRLVGIAFERATGAGDATTPSSVAPSASSIAATTPNAATTGNSALPADGAIAPLLRAQITNTSPARLLPGQRLLLPKGAFIDCTLETAIDSTLPGMTTCVTATDTFGVDGEVILLERGTKLVGETRGQVQQGMARVFVLWTEARTPTGVIVPLDSPATDELGRAGLAGTVERHFWERFGAALFISTIDGAVQAAVQSSSRGSGTVIYNPTATQDVTTEIFKNTLNIAPTVRKANGDRIQILVARDIDFTNVYELRRAGKSD